MLVFLVLNLGLLLERCHSTEFMINCSGDTGSHTAIVLVTVGLIGAASFTSIGRYFATGFFATLLALAVATTGGCTPSWADPYQTGMNRWIRPHLRERATRPAPSPPARIGR